MNIVDIVVIVVLVISGVFALIRGLVHEVLAMAGWVAAPIAAVWSLPWTAPIAGRFIHSDLASKIAAGVVVFLMVLLVCSVITHAVARKVQASALGSVDRSLGFVFGLLRGLVLCSLGYLVVTWLLPQLPEPLATARLLPLMQKGADVIQGVLPSHIDQLQDATRRAAGTATDAANAAQQLDNAKDAANGAFNQLREPKPAPAPNDPKQPNYDQSGMDRLIQNTNNGK